MKCPNCGASANDYGVYRRGSKIHCLKCGVDCNYKTGEIIQEKPSLDKLDKLIDFVRKSLETHFMNKETKNEKKRKRKDT